MKKIFVFYLGLISLTACRKDDYNASPVDPRLPELSDIGENTAGAYIDGYPWLADLPFLAEEPDLKIYSWSEGNSALLLLTNGYQVIENSLVQNDVGFYLADISMRNRYYLLSLKDTVITLDGIDNYGILIMNGSATSDTIKFGIGKLYIREARPNFAENVVFSGTFGFDFKTQGIHHTVYSGRFDYLVKSRNYFYY